MAPVESRPATPRYEGLRSTRPPLTGHRGTVSPDQGLNLLNGMLKSTRDHVTIKDLDGNYLFVNPAAAVWFDLPVDEVMGRSNEDLLRGPLAVFNRERDEQLLATGQPIEYEEELVAGPTTRTWLTTKDVIRDEHGVVIALSAISREITERVAAERALAASDAALLQSSGLLDGIMESTGDHVTVRDVSGRFLFVNRACAAWYDCAPEEVIGRTHTEIFGAESAAPVDARDRELLAAGIRMDYEETDTRHGETRTWLTTRDVVRDATGKIITLFGISRDITELRRVEAVAHQAQKMESVGRLAGGIAHDFNNLLTVIAGNAEFLVEDLEGHPGQAAAEEIASAADRAAMVTRQLLAFSRQQVLAPEVLDVQAVVHGIEPLIRRLVGAHVEIETRVDESPGLVRVDRSQLEQVLLNLVINARDAMPDGGRLTITLANVALSDADAAAHAGIAPGAYVELSVADSGVGIDATVRAQIFEPFFTTKEVGKGTGLGLSMVEGVVRQSGGDIWVDSEPGAGTTFRVYLPRLNAETKATLPAAGATPDPGGAELILLVEDEPGVREVARRILTGAGYAVLEASNPAAAFTLIEARGNDIDLLLTDVIMPGGSGPDVARRLASTNGAAGVLFMSGYTDDAISNQGVLEPHVTLIAKPFSSESLLSAVRGVLAGRTRA